MENKNLLTLAIMLTVGVILAGSLLMPLINEYSAPTKEYKNVGMPFAEVDENEHIIAISTDGITVDGETIDQSLFPGNFSEYTIVYADSALVRLLPNNKNIQVRANTSPNFSFATEGTVVTITITGTTAVVSTTASASTITINDVNHYISTEGDMILALNPVVINDSTIIGAGQTSFNASEWELPATLTVRTTWEGTMEAVTANVFSFVPADYTNLDVDSTAVNTTNLGHGLYKIDSVLINYEATDTNSETYDVTSTYTYFLAPASMIYDNPVYIGSDNVSLLAVIPLMIIVGLIVAAAGALVIKRND